MTFPLATIAPTIDSSGITAPPYADIYQSLIASFQAIYGSDIYIAPDSQDGQWLAILAQAQFDSNQAAIKLFQSFSPSYAQGAELSSLVKINGLLRNVSSNSTAVGDVGGVVGTTITAGVVQDTNGYLWDLPASVTIPGGGTITVTVTAQKTGAIAALSGDINQIATPQLGWQTFVSTSDATQGSPVESDAALRGRQSNSVAMPALAIKGAIYAAVGNVAGVSRFTVYENPTGSTDGDGIPAHSIAVVVEGGDVMAIAAAIASRKPPGIQTYGSTSEIVYDQYNLPTPINFDVLVDVPIYFAVTIKALPNYVNTTGALLIQALVDFVNALAIGEDVYTSQASAAASLIALGVGQSFYITLFYLDITPVPVATANLAIAFNAAATCVTADVSLTVT